MLLSDRVKIHNLQHVLSSNHNYKKVEQLEVCLTETVFIFEVTSARLSAFH
jgi:hypothetical protein